MEEDGEIVELNVGGTRFTTTKSTLALAGDDSFFAKLFSGRFAARRDKSGAIFIDRSPDLFLPLLDYLRTGRLTQRGAVDEEALHQEAGFYGIILAPRRGGVSTKGSNVYGYLRCRYGPKSPTCEISGSDNIPSSAREKLHSFDEIGKRIAIVEEAGWEIEHTGWREAASYELVFIGLWIFVRRDLTDPSKASSGVMLESTPVN